MNLKNEQNKLVGTDVYYGQDVTSIYNTSNKKKPLKSAEIV